MAESVLLQGVLGVAGFGFIVGEVFFVLRCYCETFEFAFQTSTLFFAASHSRFRDFLFSRVQFPD